MKYVLTIITCLVFMACEIDVNPTTDVDVTATIVKINQNEDAVVQNGKYKSPALCNTALFKNVKNNLYFTFTSCGNCIETEYHTCDHCNGGSCHHVNLNDAWVYGHSIGDTVKFKYVNQNRYFALKK